MSYTPKRKPILEINEPYPSPEYIEDVYIPHIIKQFEAYDEDSLYIEDANLLDYLSEQNIRYMVSVLERVLEKQKSQGRCSGILGTKRTKPVDLNRIKAEDQLKATMYNMKLNGDKEEAIIAHAVALSKTMEYYKGTKGLSEKRIKILFEDCRHPVCEDLDADETS